MRTLWQEFRYCARMLQQNLVFAIVATLTLALGIGANAAIFSTVYGVLLRPLPFRDPERIVTIWENNRKDAIERDDVSPANFLDWRARTRSFQEIAFANPWSLDYKGTGEAETLKGGKVTEGFFEILGINAIAGRTFSPEEFQPGKEQVAVLSYGIWTRRFANDKTVIGRKVVLDNEPFTIIGVLPREFKLNLFETPKDVWIPQTPDESFRQQRRATYLKVIARLKPAASVTDAQAEMTAIASQLANEYPQTNNGVGVTVVPLSEQMAGRSQLALWLLLGATGFVLLIACTNVANLLLARGGDRVREFAIRAAMGASRRQLIRLVLTESLLLAAIGCLVGVLLAWWGVDLIIAIGPNDVPRLEDVRLAGVPLIATVLLSLTTAFFFGLVPALRFSRPDLHGSLKESSGTASGSISRQRLRGALVVIEVALSLVLLVGAGLLLRSFAHVLKADPGFQTDRLAVLQVFIGDRYPKAEDRKAYFEEVEWRLDSLPGVRSVGLTSAFPLLPSSVNPTYPFLIEGQPPLRSGEEPTVYTTIATSHYFETMGIPLRQGRLFDDRDNMESPRVALINEAMLRRYFPDQDPVGQRVTIKYRRASTTVEIVGVVGSVRHDDFGKPASPEIFQPYAQSLGGGMAIVVRADVDPAGLLPALKSRVWEVNSEQPIYSVATMDDLISDSLRARRFSLVLLGIFAGVALVLCAAGIYGVMSYTTSRRTQEIGIRMALGASRADVVRLVLGHGLKLSLSGIALGVTSAFGVTRLMGSLLSGVSATDPATFVAIALVLFVVSALACWIPARRAMNVEPIAALRYE